MFKQTFANFCKFSAFSLELQNFSRSLKQFFLTVGTNNFGNKIPLSISEKYEKSPHSSGLAAVGNKKSTKKTDTS